jgi:hypothetical protein
MSLAMYAAPINDTNENEGLIYKKKQTHNKTQKKYQDVDFNANKVNNVLEEIHNNSKDGSDGDILGDFTPPPPPQSVGVQRTIATEDINRATEKNTYRVAGRAPAPTVEYGDNLDLNNFKMNYGDNKTTEEYYKKILPGYTHQAAKQPQHPYYNAQPMSFTDTPNQDILIQKLNYMINLLEEQQDERTGSVTEEVILYSFLGIFIIFVVDSFARAGKYAR